MENRVTGKSIKIIYEDNHLLVVEKPPNILSQGDKTGDRDMLTILKEDLKARYSKPGNVYLGLVHRLDRPVGGVMAFAKTSKAASRLSEQIRSGSFKKTYFAVITGVPDKASETLEHCIEKDQARNLVKVSAINSEKGKMAYLSYEVLGTFFPNSISHSNTLNIKPISLVKIDLHTGRPHQIRAQFSAIGHPLFGDGKYGNKAGKPQISSHEPRTDRLALWSAKIVLLHPTRNEIMEFTSMPPSEHPWNLFTVYKL